MMPLPHAAVERALRADRLAIAGHLAAGFAHELNNALSVSSLALTLSQRAVQQGEAPEAEDLESLTSTHTDMTAAAASLLVLSGSGGRSSPERVPVRACAEAALAVLTASGRLRHTSLSWSPSSVEAHVHCARTELEHLVYNLVLNGTAHQRISGRHGRMHLDLAATDGQVMLTLEDDAPPFARPGAPADLWGEDRLDVAPVGLGLWAAEALAQRLGGTIRTENHRSGPQGARVHVLLGSAA